MNKAALAAALLAATGIQTKADVITQDQSYSAQTAWMQNLTFSQFDPSLGTLNSVTVDLVGNVQLASSVDNRGFIADSPFSISDNFNLDGTVAGGTALSLNKDLTQSYLVGLGATVGQTASGSVSSAETLNASLAAWEGIGTVALPVSASDSYSYSANAGNVVSLNSTGGLDATVTYDYTAVPDGPVPMWATMGSLMIVILMGAKQPPRMPA